MPEAQLHNVSRQVWDQFKQATKLWVLHLIQAIQPKIIHATAYRSSRKGQPFPGEHSLEYIL